MSVLEHSQIEVDAGLSNENVLEAKRRDYILSLAERSLDEISDRRFPKPADAPRSRYRARPEGSGRRELDGSSSR